MPKALRTLSRLIAHFIHLESLSSIALALSAAVAMFLANGGSAETYFHTLELKIAGHSVHHWINDGLMAIFFFVVGMEIMTVFTELTPAISLN